MEKLGPVDILDEVLKAAEELQDKVDRKSYILVNAERWEIGNREKETEPQESLSAEDNGMKVLEFKSHSEAVLDLSSISMPTNFEARSYEPSLTQNGAPEFKTQISWPAHLSVDANAVNHAERSKTYESASALSLATFTSLLIEFVARLQNVVESFEELSEKAQFKDPAELTGAALEQQNGTWRRLSRCLKFWSG